MKSRIKLFISEITLLIVILSCIQINAQKPYRAGTTAANFLEIGYGQRSCAMGDAGAATSPDANSGFKRENTSDAG